MAMGRALLEFWVWLALLVRQISPQTLPMKVQSWSYVEQWRPYVREVAQIVLNHVDGATGVEQILEHRTQVAPTVAYRAEIEFAPSSDGRKKAFNMSARVFDDAFDWYAVSGTTLHTQLWLKQQRELHGPPPAPASTHTLGMLDGRMPKDNGRGHQLQLPPLLPHEIPNNMTVRVHGSAAKFSLVPSVPAEQLASDPVVPADLLVSRLSIQSGVAATLHGVHALSLADPVPLQCDLPFRWHPPMVFPPLEGGRRLAGWFIVSGLAKVESGGALSVTLSPSQDPAFRSMPKGWIPVGLAGVVATWDVEDEDQEQDEAEGLEDNKDTLWKAQLLRDLGLQEDDQAEASGREEEEEEDDVKGSASSELLRFMGNDQTVESIMPHQLHDVSKATAQELVFFKGMLTDQLTGMPLPFCPGGFSMTRPVMTLPNADHQDEPLLIEDPLATKPSEWDDVDDGEWAPAMVANPAAAASSLGLGPGWEGSYECVGNPTRARMNILETEPGGRQNTIQIVANMSFDTVTQTGGFAVRTAHSEKPLEFELMGSGTTVGAGDAGARAGYTAEVVHAKQEQEPQVILRPRQATTHDSATIGPFNINATDSRIVALLNSVERVFNQTKQVLSTIVNTEWDVQLHFWSSSKLLTRTHVVQQVAIRLTAASVQPIVIFRVVLDVAVPDDVLRVEAVVEREWGGMKRPKPVVLKPSSAETEFAHVTSLVSKSLLKGNRAIDLVELAEQLKLDKDTVETLQKVLMMEPESRDNALDTESTDTPDDGLDESVRHEDRRAESLIDGEQRQDRVAGSQTEDRDSSPTARRQDDEDEASQVGLGLFALSGRGVRMVREAFRQVADYNLFAALWGTLEQGYTNFSLFHGLVVLCFVAIILEYLILTVDLGRVNRREVPRN